MSHIFRAKNKNKAIVLSVCTDYFFYIILRSSWPFLKVALLPCGTELNWERIFGLHFPPRWAGLIKDGSLKSVSVYQYFLSRYRKGIKEKGGILQTKFWLDRIVYSLCYLRAKVPL